MDNRDWVTGRGQQGGEMERGAWGGGDGEGDHGGSGQRGGDGEVVSGEGRLGWGERGKRRVDFTDGYDEMPGWT